MSISACPKCSKQVTIPAGVDTSAIVRCPLCHAQYALADALVNMPPLLELVDDSMLDWPEPSTESADKADFERGIAETLEFTPDLDDEDDAAPEIAELGAPLTGEDETDDLEIESLGEHDELTVEEKDTEVEELGFSLSEPEAAVETGEPLDVEDDEDSVLDFDTDTPPGVDAGTPPAEQADDDAGAATIDFDDMESAGDGPQFDMEEGAPSSGGSHIDFDLPEPEFAETDMPEMAAAETGGEEEMALDFGEAIEPESAPAFVAETPEGEEAAAQEEPTGKKKKKAKKEKKAKAPGEPGKRRPMSTVLSVVLGAVVALPLALYGVLWMGPEFDITGMGKLLPKAILPASFSSQQFVATNRQVTPPTPGPIAEEPATDAPELPADEPAPPVADEQTPEAAPADAPETTEPAAEPPTEETPPAETSDQPELTPPTDEPADAPPEMPADEAPADEPPADAPAPAEPAADTPAADDPFATTTPPVEVDAPAEMPEDPLAAPADAPADDLPAPSAPADDPFAPADEPPAAANRPGASEELPSPLDSVPPAEIDAEPVGPIAAPVIGVAELSKALSDATVADQKMVAAMTSGDEAQLKKARSTFYLSLFGLAEALTFAKDDSNSGQLDTLRQGLERVVRQLAADPKRVDSLKYNSGRWIAFPNRTTPGVVLAGTVQSAARAGKLFEIKLATGIDTPAPIVTVVAAEDPGLAAGDEAIVLGSIVENPAVQLAGYEGNDSTVVWNGMAIKDAAGP